MRELKQNIGLGTIANMLVVGYSCDFFSMIWNRILPSAFFANIWLRVVVAVPALIIFVILPVWTFKEACRTTKSYINESKNEILPEVTDFTSVPFKTTPHSIESSIE